MMIEKSMIGMFVGDALGAQVEFKSKERIRSYFEEKGDFDMFDGGTFNLVKGQVTDDSEMAIALIRSFAEMGEDYDPQIARKWYKKWINASPFDYGMTTSDALWHGEYNYNSQANGALMRCAPLAWKYRNRSLAYLMKVAEEDCKITHPNKVCIDANKVYLAIMYYMMHGYMPCKAYNAVCDELFFRQYDICMVVQETMEVAKTENAKDFDTNQGWVLSALHNALYHLWNYTDFEVAMKETIFNGGDTDTNACICGALIGVWKEISSKWHDVVKGCEPDTKARHSRPEWLWTSKWYELINIIEK